MKTLEMMAFGLLLSSSLLLGQSSFKNLQVLDFKTEKELKPFMKSIAKDLGVKCAYCHDLNDKSIDTKRKKIARGMIQMTQHLNEDVFSWSDEPKISCWTCHRGEKEPPSRRP
ncbi:MAG: c-type cytochrome [Fidelibacterota bacterium]